MPITILGDEILGDDILGDDDDLGAQDLVGALVPRGRASLARVAQAAQAGRAVVRTQEPTRSREQVLGFDSVAVVAAAATANIVSRPQVVFRPDRLIIPATIAASFLLNDIRIGRASQLTSGTAVPCEAFGQTAFGVRMRMDTAQVSMDVALNVTNISAGALRFLAALIGPCVE